MRRVPVSQRGGACHGATLHSRLHHCSCLIFFSHRARPLTPLLMDSPLPSSRILSSFFLTRLSAPPPPSTLLSSLTKLNSSSGVNRILMVISRYQQTPLRGRLFCCCEKSLPLPQTPALSHHPLGLRESIPAERGGNKPWTGQRSITELCGRRRERLV